MAFSSFEEKMEWYTDFKYNIAAVKKAEANILQAKTNVAKSKAEQTKAILGQKYVALRIETNTRDRFASARKAKEAAMQRGFPCFSLC